MNYETLNVKDIVVKRIDSHSANSFVKRWHYSGKVCANSQLHFGCFVENILMGVMSFGCSLDKRKTIGFVEGTKWNEFVELNRMAFHNLLPKNSESRCLSVAIRLIKKHCPHIKWILSYADGTQSGDGTIYRASGFYLTSIKINKTILRWNGKIISDKTLNNTNYRKKGISASKAKKYGAKPLKGFQLRYIYFIDKTYKLNCPILPFSEIEKAGAKMYKGKCAGGIINSAMGDQPIGSGVNPTPALQEVY